MTDTTPVTIEVDSIDVTPEIALEFVQSYEHESGSVLDAFATGETVDFHALANEAYDVADEPNVDEYSWRALGEWAENEAGAQR